jgi:ABC-type sugar transport system permease subunit
MANTALAGSKKRKSNVKFWHREGFVGYMFMIPTLIGFSVFVAYPLIVSMYTAFTEWDSVNPPQWVGLENFKYIFTQDPVFYKSVGVTFLYVIYTVPISLLLGMALAVLLNKSLPGIRIFRTLYYLPAITPAVASLVLWMFIYKSDTGILNLFLSNIGLPKVGWLTDPKVVLISLGIIKFWGVGSMMIIFLSGLQSVPVDVYEAADLDGANGWQKFWKITFPLITPIFFLQLVTGLIGAFQAFNEAAIMTKGGPNYASHLLSYEIYLSAFTNYKFGLATAEVWVLFFIIMIFTVIVFSKSEQYVYYENE